MGEESFSFSDLRNAARVDLPPVEFLSGTDGVALAYRAYVPEKPRSVLLFYHGGGAHSGAGYQFLGRGLQSVYDTVVLTPDIRGHGASGGRRGDAPTVDIVWEDISSVLSLAHSRFPELPVFLGGHSSGAGLTLNYSSRDRREAVDGYVFLSPQLGVRANADRPALAAPFATVDRAGFASFAASGGTEHGHEYAVQFNYPEEVLASDPGLVRAITVTMSLALTPSAPGDQFASLDIPFGLWIGTGDELFLPERVLAFGTLPRDLHPNTYCASIPGGKHLSVLLAAHHAIGAWIKRVNK